MPETRNIFISHVHEDDALLPPLKRLLVKAGMTVRDSSINSDKPNNAQSEGYIKGEILGPRIRWASTLVVLITHNTGHSKWVNWEIDYAVGQGKRVVGVYAHGATSADLPEALERLGDAAVVGWRGERVVDAINGLLQDWDDPTSGEPRDSVWLVSRYSCG